MVLTKSELNDSLKKEVRILLHLTGKLDRTQLDYRPGPKQRSAIDLLRYLSFMGPTLIQAAKSIGANGLDLSADAAITRDLVAKSNAAGLPVFVWTVDDLEIARCMIDAGVAGIATNRPGWLRQQLTG